jgi:hypothetical protein
MKTIRDLNKARELVTGSSFKTMVCGFKYSDLVKVLGEPTYPNGSADCKVQIEWVVEFNGNGVSIYDWKTYDREWTMNKLMCWHIGCKYDAAEFVEYLKNELLKFC